MRVKRSALVLVLAAAAVVVGAASYAFACSAQANLAPLAPGEGARGTEVTVTPTVWSTGPNSETSTGSVEIRWGSQTGPLLATAQGQEWSAKVAIPDAEPDYYLIVALSRGASGAVVLRSSQTFHLTGPAPTPAATTGAATTPAGSTGAATSSSPSPAPTELATTSAAAPAASSATSAPSPATSPVTGSEPVASWSAAPATAATAAVTGPTTSVNRPVRATGAAPATAGAASPAGVAPLAPAESTAPPVASAQPLPDPATAWADTGADTTRARPSLASEVQASHGSNGMAVALLAVGGLGMLATGLTVAASRRRRVARASTR